MTIDFPLGLADDPEAFAAATAAADRDFLHDMGFDSDTPEWKISDDVRRNPTGRQAPCGCFIRADGSRWFRCMTHDIRTEAQKATDTEISNYYRRCAEEGRDSGD